MTAVSRLEGLNRDVYSLLAAAQVAGAQRITGDFEGAKQTIQNAWEPLCDVPLGMIAAVGGKIIGLMRD